MKALPLLRIVFFMRNFWLQVVDTGSVSRLSLRSVEGRVQRKAVSRKGTQGVWRPVITKVPCASSLLGQGD
jgi:hypothetical protein